MTTKKSSTPTKSKTAARAKKTATVEVAHKKVLFCTAEAAPFIRTGGLGDVAGALPLALSRMGVDVRVVLPYYQDIPETYRHTMNYIGNTTVPLAWRSQYCGVFTQTIEGVKYYFIDNEYYFKRAGLYGHYDDAERFAFFSRAILEMLSVIDFYPDVIHCNDWQTALVPVMKDVFYQGRPEIISAKTLYTVHNIEFQGKYGREIVQDPPPLRFATSRLPPVLPILRNSANCLSMRSKLCFPMISDTIPSCVRSVFAMKRILFPK